MNNLYHLVLCCCIFCSADMYSQFGEQHLVDEKLAGARSVVATDLNGDGELDILLSKSSLTEVIFWYENIDNASDFSSRNEIETLFSSSRTSFPADFDGDGDQDVLTTFTSDGKIVWFENLDGDGDFGEDSVILNFEDGVIDARAIDIDDDDDLDVVYISFFDANIGWLENLDGLGDFGPATIISSTAFGGSQIAGGDIDGDGDIDLLSANGAIDTVAWHENLDGAGTFSAPQIVSQNNDGVINVRLEDVDGDNDLDAVACSISDDKIAWYENIDGQGVFTVEHVINSTSNAPRALYTSDLDNDGDIDILSMSQNEESPLGTIFWQENLDGLGNFGPTLLINDELHAVRSVYAADLDNDGDNDVLFSDLAEDVIGWHENLTILGVEKPELATIAIYPNPTISQLYVKTPLSVSKIEVYTILSKLVTVATKNIIDVSSLIPATYVLKITLIDGSTSYKKFVKK